VDADPPLPATADAGADADASVTPHPLARWIGASASRRGFGRLVVAAFAAFGGATGLGALAAGTDIAARCAGPGKRCGKGGRLRCCGGSRCRKRKCACAAGLTACGGRCVNLLQSSAHCGGCGRACGGGAVCRQGVCARGDDGGGGGNGGGGGDGGNGGDNDGSPIGTNLAGVTDYATERPFADVFKTARPWFSGVDGGTWEDGRTLDLDADGNVRSLASGQVARSVLFTASPPDPDLSDAVFHVRWRGSGTLEYGNVTVVSQSPGRDVIRLRTVTGPDSDLIVIVNLVQTDPANPLRDVTMTQAGGICRSDPFTAVDGSASCPGGDYSGFAEDPARARFEPRFLRNLRPFASLRFMDWAGVNNSTLASFADRPLVSHQFWSTPRGVPVEIMCEACNVLGADAWFAIPHLLDDAGVEAWGALAARELTAGRKVSVEWSNEVWNGIFDQTWHAEDEGHAAGLDTGGDRFVGMLRYYANRAGQIHDRFVTGFGDASRVRRVMATQAANDFLTTTILEQVESVHGAGSAANRVDLLAIAPYFGLTIADADDARTMKRLGVDGIFDWLLNDPAGAPVFGYGSVRQIRGIIAEQVAAAGAFDVPLGSYEGGQHFVGVGGFENDGDLNDLFDAVNRDPRMKQVYLAYLDDWRGQTGQIFHHFTDVDGFSKWGRWGAKEYPGQSRAAAPKYDALLTYAEQSPL
jgi:hypothetical protein